MQETTEPRTIDADSAWWSKAGVIASFTWLYICTIALVLLIPPGHVKKESLGFNELGDALAGFFVPLGLIWVVVGVMLQHLQTKQNTDAIEMQGRELKLAVKEFAEMAQEQKRTNDIAIENQLEARRQVKPDLIYSAHVDPYGKDPGILQVFNRGAACIVKIHALGLQEASANADIRDRVSGVLHNGHTHGFMLRLSENATRQATTYGLRIFVVTRYAEPAALHQGEFNQKMSEVYTLKIDDDGLATFEKRC